MIAIFLFLDMPTLKLRLFFHHSNDKKQFSWLPLQQKIKFFSPDL